MPEGTASPAEQSPLLSQRVSLSSNASSTSKSTGSHSSPGPDSDREPAPAISASRATVVIASIGLLIFLQATNISILTTTQSAIAADLDAFEEVSWLTSSYLIAMSSISPLSGRLCQLFSPRICIFVSTMIVCIGSIITSLSSSLGVFLFGRAVTGTGAAGILVVATIIAIQLAGAKHRGLYIGLINSGMTVGVSLGAVIAGAVEPKYGWKILFGVQAPLSLLAGLCLLWGIPQKFSAGERAYTDLSLRRKLKRVDYFGALTLTSTIVLFLLGLSGPRVLPLPMILSAIIFPVFVVNEARYAADPIIPMMVLRSRGALLTCLATVGFMMARWSLLFYTPVYALAVRGWSPAVAGSILIPTNVGFASGGLLAGLLHIRRAGSFYVSSLVTMGLFPITLLLLGLFSIPETPTAAYITLVFFNGFLTGASLNYTMVHALHLTPPSVHPIVLSLVATFRGFAGSFGSAIGGGLFTRILRKALIEGYVNAGLKHRESLVRRLIGSPALVRGLEDTEQVVAINAYVTAVRILFFAAMGLACCVVFIQAGTGWKPATQAARDTIEEHEANEAEDEEEEEETLIGGA